MNARHRPEWRSRAVPVLVAVATVAVVAMVTGSAQGAVATIVPLVVVGGSVAAAVWAVRRWRADRRAYEQRLTKWAVVEERLKIARDLHDIVSHGLGLITVRAASTRHLEKPAEVDSALTDIEQVSRTATAELRRMLDVLRDKSGDAPIQPADDLTVLPEIVRAAETSGVRPELTVTDLGKVSPGVQLAICQTVREALSNTARHAGPTDVRVVVRRDEETLVVSVVDAGATPGWRREPGAGHGLVGLRERITALGGTLAARPKNGGFQLTARIPDEVVA
ncbi:two-component sensor histidine kinase [Actinoplanes sp. LDG1-06]|uniref:histidine kinase n=1 Tax=Paractinoplanes ovalisporus TaxID=2810368 RepID=A0ABS2AET0_9ACTN|nr:histidine kinase [Actinoplanes ovalisporus]MBM2618341.1 two-component sensor histidine kinase [Actinoplanes ovalisporus]